MGRSTLSANKAACVVLFHGVVSKATQGLVSSCGRTGIYPDFVSYSPPGKRQFGTRLMGTECWYQLQGREIW